MPSRGVAGESRRASSCPSSDGDSNKALSMEEETPNGICVFLCCVCSSPLCTEYVIREKGVDGLPSASALMICCWFGDILSTVIDMGAGGSSMEGTPGVGLAIELSVAGPSWYEKSSSSPQTENR